MSVVPANPTPPTFVIPTGVITPTPFPFPPPTRLPDAYYEPTDAAQFEQALIFNSIDMRCRPPCWQNFQPGVTSFALAAAHFERLFGLRTGTNGEPNVPRNSISISQFGVIIRAYSDADARPKLRAVYLDFRTFQTLISPSQEQWQPTALLKELAPKSIVLDRFRWPAGVVGRTFITLHYDGWSFRFSAAEFLTGSDNTRALCLPKESHGFSIWIYPQSESSLDAMIADLNTYPNISIPSITADRSIKFTTTEKVNAARTLLTSQECVEISKIEALGSD